MTIFLTGATGYLGRALADALALAGYTVLGLARSDASAHQLEAAGFAVHRGDLFDADALAAGARRADAVIHAAATGDDRQAEADRAAVETLLDALSGSNKPLLYTSGIWVLGDTGEEVATEDAPLRPADLVRWRPAVEQRVLQAEGVRGVVIRPGVVYGRGGGIPRLLMDWATERGHARLVGDGANRWPLVHADDLGDLYVRALDAPAGTLLHAASESGLPAREVALAAAEAAGVAPTVETWPLDDARTELGTFADALALDQRMGSDRAERLLGWTPSAPSILDEFRSGSYAPQATERNAYICVTCGTQFPETNGPPAGCPICEDERQYVGLDGQAWTTPEALRRSHSNAVRTLEPGLTEVHTEPGFAIGQRALLVETPEGNVLWDCVTLLDEATVEAVRERGGISAIVLSHPHYYSAMAEWARTFDAPVYVHAADRGWVARPDERIVFWEGDRLTLPGGLTALRTGGHFEGSTVLHWSAGAGGRGALLTGDTIKVAMDRRFVSFMYSFPNHIPLPSAEVQHIAGAVASLAFDRIYGAWPGHTIRTGAHEAVRRSAERYAAALAGTHERPKGPFLHELAETLAGVSH